LSVVSRNSVAYYYHNMSINCVHHRTTIMRTFSQLSPHRNHHDLLYILLYSSGVDNFVATVVGRKILLFSRLAFCQYIFYYRCVYTLYLTIVSDDYHITQTRTLQIDLIITRPPSPTQIEPALYVYAWENRSARWYYIRNIMIINKSDFCTLTLCCLLPVFLQQLFRRIPIMPALLKIATLYKSFRDKIRNGSVCPACNRRTFYFLSKAQNTYYTLISCNK